MLKKIFIVLACIFVIAGCSCNKDIKAFRLDDKYYTSTDKGLHELDSYDDITTMIDNKESFAVYLYTPGCPACANFRPILEQYLNDKNLMMYSISNSIVSVTNNEISDRVRFAPSVILFKEGTFVTFLDSLSDDHEPHYKSSESFGEWFETYIDIIVNN